MKKTGLKLITLAAVAIPLALVVLTACEKEKSASDDVDAYFAAHPYLSDPRKDRTDLSIIPDSAQISTVGEKVMFQAMNGSKPLNWDVVDPNNGSIQEQEDERYALYTANTLGPNTVVVSDRRGMAALADINSSANPLVITPDSAELANDGDVVALSASGGTPPYYWQISYPLLGQFIPSGLDYAEGEIVYYQRISEGDNIVVLTDHHQRTKTIVIKQTEPLAPTISPNPGILEVGDNFELFKVNNGVPPYNWTLPAGGGSLDPSTGVQTLFTRGAGVLPGDYAIQVTDGNGSTALGTIRLY